MNTGAPATTSPLVLYTATDGTRHIERVSESLAAVLFAANLAVLATREENGG